MNDNNVVDMFSKTKIEIEQIEDSNSEPTKSKKEMFIDYLNTIDDSKIEDIYLIGKSKDGLTYYKYEGYEDYKEVIFDLEMTLLDIKNSVFDIMFT
jgi:hypothetical protein